MSGETKTSIRKFIPQQDGIHSYPYALGMTLSTCEIASQILEHCLTLDKTGQRDAIKRAIEMLQSAKPKAAKLVDHNFGEGEAES